MRARACKPSRRGGRRPGPNFWTTGSGRRIRPLAHGVGLVVAQARLTIAPPATFRSRRDLLATVMCVASGMLVIDRVGFVMVLVVEMSPGWSASGRP